MKMTIHSNRVPRIRIGGAIPSLPHVPSWHAYGGWVDLKAGLDSVRKRRIAYPCQESNPCSLVIYYRSHNTDRAVEALFTRVCLLICTFKRKYSRGFVTLKSNREIIWF
jgi:hypothetical protein